MACLQFLLINFVVLCSQVMSQRTCSSFSNAGLFYHRGSSLVKGFSFWNRRHNCTYSSGEFGSSKRRSRGPMMAAKKASEGVYLLILELETQQEISKNMALYYIGA